ncbi:MAG: RsmG family class I SAM-dependent methyltransferase [Acidimicrobiales bacterium]
MGFAGAAETCAWGGSGTFLDLGSGGGLPGLVLAWHWPKARAVLLEANERRAGHLRQCVTDCGWDHRATVVHSRAEPAGRLPDLRHRVDLVVARSFGPPATAAECAAPFLRVGGLLVVSEPPLAEDEAGPLEAGSPRRPASVGHPERWPTGDLAQLGLETLAFVSEPAGYQVLRQRELCPDRFPRRDGVPAKRPLF